MKEPLGARQTDAPPQPVGTGGGTEYPSLKTAHFSPEELCAAYLADPGRVPPPDLPWSACDMQWLLKVLRQNKVPLLSLPLAALKTWPEPMAVASPDLAPLDDSSTRVPLVLGPAFFAGKAAQDPAFRSARQAEADELAQLRAEYKLVHEALAVDGITGVFIKSVGLEPSFPFKSDNLDVLYQPQHIERVEETLRQLGYVELKNMEEPLKYLFRKFHGGRCVCAIHVHEHVGWMVSFLDEERLWQRCRSADDDALVIIPGPEDALLTNLAHWFYEDKRLTLQDMAKCAHCMRQGVDWDEVYRIATWRGWADGLNVSLLIYAYQECALHGQTLVPASVLNKVWQDTPVWGRLLLEGHLGASALGAVRDSWSMAPALQGEEDGRQAHHVNDSHRSTRQTDAPPQPVRTGGGTDAGGRPAASGTRSSQQPEHGTKGRAEVPLRVPFFLSKMLFYAKLLRDPTRGTARKIKDLAVHTGYGTKLRLRIHSQPALLVTLSGTDGCGKTTQARALQSAFEVCHLRANYVWSRAGSANWLALLLSLRSRLRTRWSKHRAAKDYLRADRQPAVRELDRQSPGEGTAGKIQARQERLRSPWIRSAWACLTAVELLLQYTWRVTLPLLLGRVVICDRYTYDALADWSAYFGEAAIEKRLAARVLSSLSPQPHISYWLDVPVELARSRSVDGLPAQFVAAQAAAYGRLANLYGLRRLDGSGSGKDVSDMVVYDVLSTYFSHYRTWVNSLFLKNPGQWR